MLYLFPVFYFSRHASKIISMKTDFAILDLELQLFVRSGMADFTSPLLCF